MNSYKLAGVDVEAGYETTKRIKENLKNQHSDRIISGVGGFGSVFKLDLKKYPNPLLVSGTDGVGTKLKLAFYLDKHDTIGVDCVAMCVNDIICQGADPLYFLDYIATDKNTPEKMEQIIKGVIQGCEESNCYLVGGETAEMPGMYHKNEYDVAGFVVGAVDESNFIDFSDVQEGDAIIGLKSSGVHSNGFSLVRKVFNIEENKTILNKHFEELGNTLGNELIKPTKIYVKSISKIKELTNIKAVSHITGGGWFENIPRILKDNHDAKVYKNATETPNIFKLISSKGNISEEDMFGTFNMGIGMIVVIPKEDVKKTLKALGDEAVNLGQIISGNKKVQLC